MVTWLVSCRQVGWRDLQGPTHNRRQARFVAEFATWSSAEIPSNELDNEVLVQRRRELQRCERWLPMYVASDGATQAASARCTQDGAADELAGAGFLWVRFEGAWHLPTALSVNADPAVGANAEVILATMESKRA